MNQPTPPANADQLNTGLQSLQKGVLLTIAFVAALSLVWGLGHAAARYRLGQAETQLTKGFAALAAETLEASRLQLVRSRRGCQALIDAYAGARRNDRLEWATQACSEAGFAVIARNVHAMNSNDEITRKPASPSNSAAPSLSPATAPHAF